jgi:hypothetical protein
MTSSSHHEAGYDAFNTARVLLYMAPIIQNLQPYLVSKIYRGEVNISQVTLYMLEALCGTDAFKKVLEAAKAEAKENEEKEAKVIEEKDEYQEIRDANKPKPERPTGALEIAVEAETEKLLSQPKAPPPPPVLLKGNPFAILQSDSPVEEEEESAPEDYGWSEDETEDTPEHKRKKPALIPSLKRVAGEEFFWSQFGNRLRVFGTIENVAVLGELDDALEDAEHGVKEKIEIKEGGEKVGEIKLGDGSLKIEVGKEKEERKKDGSEELLDALRM